MTWRYRTVPVSSVRRDFHRALKNRPLLTLLINPSKIEKPERLKDLGVIGSGREANPVKLSALRQCHMYDHVFE